MGHAHLKEIEAETVKASGLLIGTLLGGMLVVSSYLVDIPSVASLLFQYDPATAGGEPFRTPYSQVLALLGHGFGPLLDCLNVVDPIGYRDFLALGAESAFLISDSGGVQEEVSVYKRPLIVVRRSTERPEVLGTFAELVEPGPAITDIAIDWLSRLGELHQELAVIPSPYGDASAPQRSVDTIVELVDG